MMNFLKSFLLLVPLSLLANEANLATTATVSASSERSEFPASHIIDGTISEKSRWLTIEEDAHPWLELTLTAPTTVGNVIVHSGLNDNSHAMPDYDLSVEINGKWVEIEKVRSNTDATKKINLNKENVSKLKFTLTSQNPARVKEIQIFSATSEDLAAAQIRYWVMNNGHIFNGTFEKFDSGTAVVTLENGKSQRIPVANLSVSDRYYMHKEQGVPIADMEGGNYLTAERDLKIKDTDYEVIPSFTLEGEGYKAEMGAVVTPHYLFLHDKGAKVKEYTTGLEKVVFSHAYRMPNSLDMRSKTRKTFLFIKDFDLYKELGKALVDTLRKEGKASTRSINQLEVDWIQYAGHRSFTLPKELAEKYGASQNAEIEFAGKRQKDRRGHVKWLINRYWGGYPHKAHVHGGIPRSHTEKFSTNRQNNANLCYLYALISSNSIRLWEGINVGGGGAMEQSGFHHYGFYGDPKKWGAKLAAKVKSGSLTPDFEQFYVTPSNSDKVIEREEFTDYWLVVSALGRFMDQDLRHQIGVCRLYEYMHKNRKTPPKDEIPALFGYDSVDELNAAFKDFIITKNTRVKY